MPPYRQIAAPPWAPVHKTVGKARLAVCGDCRMRRTIAAGRVHFNVGCGEGDALVRPFFTGRVINR